VNLRDSLRLSALLLAVACGRGGEPRAPSAHVEAHWSGSEDGKISGPASAEWCAVLRLLEIRGIRGDTGFAIAVYPRDSVRQGEYRVVDPALADSQSPAAGVALRWAAQTSIRGFQSESGRVVLRRSAAGELSGVVTAALRSVTDTARLRLVGSFRGLSVRPQTRGCSKAAAEPSDDAQPSDTQLH
jgi:hypothetical protein